MKKSNNTEILISKAEAKVELLRRAAKRGNFWSYCLYMDFDFFSKRAILKKVADVLQKVYDAYKVEKSIYVGISMPPRSGKSYIVSLFCSFMLGHFPTKSIMRNTCTATLYDKLSKDTRDLVDSVKWRSIFEMVLKTRGVKTWGLEQATQTSYFGGGTGGTIIGFGVSMLDITDDLYKGWADAMSETTNQATIDWSEATRGSRFERGCCQIDVGTRWRKNDIIGINVEKGKYDYDICIPALDENNKSFCEDVNTTEFYLNKKKEIAPEIWESEYMQHPVDVKGRLFNPDDLMYFDELPNGEPDANIGVADTADTGKDNFSAPFVKKYGDKYYLYDWLFTTDSMDITSPLIIGKIKENEIEKIRFESNNGGKLFAKNVEKEVNADVTWKATTVNKETRILMDSTWIKRHIVFKRDNRDRDYSKAFEQLITYIKMGEKQPDDSCDSLSILYRFIMETGLNLTHTESINREDWSSDPISPWQVF